MNFSNLSQIPSSDIHSAFIRAFSDYQIPVEMTFQEMVLENMQRGVDYTASFGAFSDNGELTGFILCGVRENEGTLSYYDSATAVIPAYRGRGIARLLLDKVLADANSRGAHTFVLEVIQDNLKAQKLYESHGFSTSRELRCFQKQLEDIHSVTTSSYEIYAPDVNEFLRIAESIPLLYTPSWQNSFSSVASIFDQLTTRVLTQKGNPVGYFVLSSSTGHILQMSAEAGSPEIFKELISQAKLCTKANSLQCINIEGGSPFITFLEEDAWSLLVDQYEMTRHFEHT